MNVFFYAVGKCDISIDFQLLTLDSLLIAAKRDWGMLKKMTDCTFALRDLQCSISPTNGAPFEHPFLSLLTANSNRPKLDR